VQIVGSNQAMRSASSSGSFGITVVARLRAKPRTENTPERLRVWRQGQPSCLDLKTLSLVVGVFDFECHCNAALYRMLDSLASMSQRKEVLMRIISQ